MTKRDDALVFECALDAAPEKVWRALSIPAFREQWLSTGGKHDAADTSEVLDAEPPKSLTLSWRDRADQTDGAVVFTLAPMPGGGTWLRLEHQRVLQPLPIPANANTMMLRAA